jgi:hypothetical protein
MSKKLRLTHVISHLAFLTVITIIFLESGLITSVKYALAQNTNNDKLFCYLQTSDGKKINLDALCGVTSQKNSISNLQQPLNISNSEQPLSVENVTLTIETIRDKIVKNKTIRHYYISGSITNKGNIAQRNIKVNYKVYKLRDGNLEVDNSNKNSVKTFFLKPGETTKFIDEIRNRPDLLMIDSLNSIESDLIPVNICYGTGVEQRELCKRINPTSVEELNYKRISS